VTEVRQSGSIASVVPTHNRREPLRACLRALFGQTWPLQAVIVIDNGSTDGSREMVASEFPSARYVRIERPCGSAGGFAEGISQACAQGYEWIWLMDNDAVPAPDALEGLVAASREVEGRVFNSLVVTPDGRHVNWGYHLYQGDGYAEGSREIRQIADLLALGRPILNGLAQFYTGALLHRSVVDTVGLPTVGYFTRGDEVDYVLRIQRAGFKTWTVVASRVVHAEEPRHPSTGFGHRFTFPAVAPWKQYYMLRNDLINGCRYNFRGESMPRLFLRSFLLHCAGSLALPDHKLRRLFYTCWAFADALLGRVYVNPYV
jgi:rhamnopyranosyl-N-acetylglucosaminyl-diphospho-decaprenol beta-1,3/1,4-galactofuranosyltransferase